MQPVKSLSQGSRRDANIANLGYWPTDRNTIEAISKLLVVQPETDVQLFDCSCGKLDALAPISNALSRMGAKTSLWGIELHDERFQTAHTYLSVRGIQGSVLHADAISPDVSVSENWASVSIFNPPYGDQKYERDGQQISVRLERIFWTKHIARTKRGTGITVAILPTQLFRADPNLTRMIGRHFVQGRVFRAETDDFNQVVIIGYRQKANLATSSVDNDLIETLTGLGFGTVDVPKVSEANCQPWLVNAGQEPNQFSCSNLSSVMAKAIIDSERMAINQAYQRLIQHQQRNLAENKPLNTITPLRLGHVPAVLASGRLNGKFETPAGTFLFRGRRQRIVENEIRKEVDPDTGIAVHISETIHKPITAVSYLDVTPGREPVLTEVA